jgi:hypothetical protein
MQISKNDRRERAWRCTGAAFGTEGVGRGCRADHVTIGARDRKESVRVKVACMRRRGRARRLAKPGAEPTHGQIARAG